MTQRQYGPTDETQEIPYNPKERETREIPVQKNSDSAKLRAIAGAYGYVISSQVPKLIPNSDLDNIEGPEIGFHNETLLLRASCKLTLQEVLKAHKELEAYKRSKGESK